MYLRPRQCFEKFLLVEEKNSVDDIGRVHVERTLADELVAAISTLNPKEAEKFSGMKHQISHVLISKQKKGSIGDLLIKDDATFRIQHVEEIPCGFILYYVERRNDID